MEITKKVSQKFGAIYITDLLCPQCKKEKELIQLDYSLAGEVLQCRVCGYESDWRPILDSDVCTNFPHPNAPPQPETAKPVRFDSDVETLAEAALAAIRFPIAYSDWLKCGFGLASEFGARRAAELMFKYAPPTKQGETVEDYERTFSKSNGSVSIGTLFQIAKAHGFQFPTTRAPQVTTSHASEKYPLERLNGHATPDELEDETDEQPDESDALVFDEHLIQRATLFERLYTHYLRNDVPPQFAFVGALATLAAVIGDRAKIEFADQSLKPNDYFVLLTASGGGKSTALMPIQSLLQRLEAKIQYDPNDANIFLYPSVSTQRGLLDIMREASDAEKSVGATKQPQSSGLLIVDEITALFSEMNAAHSSQLDSIVLRLWDGAPMCFATSKRLDGRYRVPESALSIVGASTPLKFRTALPKTAFSDGLLARMNFIHAPRRTKPRKSIGELLSLSSPLNDETDRLLDALLELFQFIMKVREIVVTADAIKTDKANVERWFEEQNGISDNEAIDAYYNRIAARCWRYSIILAVCRSFQRGESKIVIDAEIIQHAARLADYFKAQFIYFVQRSGGNDEKGLDQIGRAKLRLIRLIADKFGGQVKMKTLRDYSGLGKNVFEIALNELFDIGRVKKEQRPNANNRLVDWIVMPKNDKSRFFTSSLLHFNEKGETEKKLKSGSEEKKRSEECGVLEVQKTETPEPCPPSDVAKPEPTVSPEPTVPTQPTTPVPESLQVACEVAKSLHAEFSFKDFIRTATLYHGVSEAVAKEMLNILLQHGYIERTKYGYIRTQRIT